MCVVAGFVVKLSQSDYIIIYNMFGCMRSFGFVCLDLCQNAIA